MGTKKCGKCQQTKNLNDFPFKKKLQGIRGSYCFKCNTSYLKKYYKKNRRRCIDRNLKYKKAKQVEMVEILLEYFKSHPCECGESNPVLLDFHHLGKKTGNVSTLICEGRSRDSILNEISKCKVLCVKCHRLETAKCQGWMRFLKST